MDVYNGVFLGNMNNNQGYTTAYSGPASSYGIKIIGGAKVNLHDGKYDGKGGGVMVTESHTYNNGAVSGTTAELYIHKGEYASMSATDGIMIYEYAKVIIGASKVYGDTTDDIVVAQKDIEIAAHLCPISCNTLTGNLQSNQRSQVSVYYGHFKYGQTVGWNESSKDMRVADVVLYNTSIYDSTGTEKLVAYEYQYGSGGGLGGGVGLDNNTDVKSYVN